MKQISELEADVFFDLLELVLPLVPMALENQYILESIGLGSNPNDRDPLKTNISFMKGISELILPFISKYRDSAYKILSLLNEMSVEDLKKVQSVEITNMLKGLIKDQNFKAFFIQPTN